MGKFKELDTKIELAVREIVAFITEVDRRKQLSTLEGKVDSNYTKNINYTDSEVLKIKTQFEELINQIEVDGEVEITNKLNALRTELEEKIKNQGDNIDSKFNNFSTEINSKITDIENKLSQDLSDIRDEILQQGDKISKNSEDIQEVADIFMNILIENVKSKKAISDSLNSILLIKDETDALKSKAETDLKLLLEFMSSGEEVDPGELYPVLIPQLEEIYEKYLTFQKSTDSYLEAVIKNLRKETVNESKGYTDSKVEELKNYTDNAVAVSESGVDTKIANIDFCEEFKKLPEANIWENDFKAISITDEGCKAINQNSFGIFTDLRMFTRFSAEANVGDVSNILIRVVNVSTPDIKNIDIVIELPESGANITYGAEALTPPSKGSYTLTKTMTKGNLIAFRLSGIANKDKAEISIPITFGEEGIFKATAQISSKDVNIESYNQRDDYRVSTIIVKPATP